MPKQYAVRGEDSTVPWVSAEGCPLGQGDSYLTWLEISPLEGFQPKLPVNDWLLPINDYYSSEIEVEQYNCATPVMLCYCRPQGRNFVLRLAGTIDEKKLCSWV